MPAGKSLWQVFNERVDALTENMRAKAREVIDDRLKLYEYEIPASMRKGLDRIDHEGKGQMMEAQSHALAKGGLRGAFAALDILSYYGTHLHFSKDQSARKVSLG